MRLKYLSFRHENHEPGFENTPHVAAFKHLNSIRCVKHMNCLSKPKNYYRKSV